MKKLAAFAALSLATLGCTKPAEYAAPPPPDVTVAQPLVKTVTNYLDETGTTEAVKRVEVRARVRGYLMEQLFQAGTDVKAGDLLYKIDPREYAAKVAAAEAELKLARGKSGEGRDRIQASEEVAGKQRDIGNGRGCRAG